MKRVLALCALVTACAPELDDRPYLIERERLLAVIAEPPELRQRAEVRLTPVVAARRRNARAPAYHFCAAPPPPADPRAISSACLEDASLPLGNDGESAQGMLPADACAHFGPDPVGSDFRPRDADATGGFYQPLVIDGFGERAVAQLRILCPLPDVPVELSRAYSEGYQANNNPHGLELERELDGRWQALGALTAGERVSLRVSWEPAARERYVSLAPDAGSLVERLEALRINWFATGGALAEAVTSVDEAEPLAASPNIFVAPERPGSVELWAVVHDSRGGTAVTRRALTITQP